MPRKPQKNPIDQPADGVLGKWYPKMVDGFASEEMAHQRRMAAKYPQVAALLGVSADGNKHGEEFWDEVRDWWPVVVLREAAREGDVEGYKRLLSLVLTKLNITPPDGVLEPYRWPGGRPSETNPKLVVAWRELLRRPRLTKEITELIAYTVYAPEWEQSKEAKPPARNAKLKGQRDGVRATILRYKAATKCTIVS